MPKVSFHQRQLIDDCSNNHNGTAMASTFTFKQGSSVITDHEAILSASQNISVVLHVN